MQSILYVPCSPRGVDSLSRHFAEEVLIRLRQRDPAAMVRTRDLSADPPPLVGASFSAAVLLPPTACEAFARSEALIEELEDADAVVIATPMHNFGVPAVLKAWIDQVVRIHRSFTSTPAGKIGNLRDRPVFIVIASGGWFSGQSPTGGPAQPDFLTPYLRVVLATIGISDIHFLLLEGATRGATTLHHSIAQARAALDRALDETV